MTTNPLEIIKSQDTLLHKQMGENHSLAFADGAISLKNKLLIALAIDCVIKADGGIKTLATQALENSATKQEIMEVLRIVNFICGVGSSYNATVALKDILK